MHDYGAHMSDLSAWGAGRIAAYVGRRWQMCLAPNLPESVVSRPQHSHRFFHAFWPRRSSFGHCAKKSICAA
jgi:hypothetical protein